MKRLAIKLNRFSHPIEQVFLMAFTCIILVLLTYKALNSHKIFDAYPHILNINSAQKQNLEPIKTGFFLRNFIDFDMQKNDFLFEGVIWFIFDPKKISQDLIEKFSFNKGEILKNGLLADKTGMFKREMPDGNIFVRYDIRVKFTSNLNYHFFPIDSHKLSIVLNNKFLDANKFYFDIDKSQAIFSESLFTPGWTRINEDVESGYGQTILNKQNQELNSVFPRAIFTMDFVTSSFRDILLIFLPLFVVFFLSLFVFSFNPHNKDIILGISASVVPAILGYRFVIETMSPKVSYFILSDHIFTMFLILAFLLFFMNTFYIEKLKNYHGILIVIFHTLLILSWTYLLFFWR